MIGGCAGAAVAFHGFGAQIRTTVDKVAMAKWCGGTDLPKIVYAAPIVLLF